MASEESVIDWLLDGDPAIRWQVMRDLLDEPAEAWEQERNKTVESGWVAELLGQRLPDGAWATISRSVAGLIGTRFIEAIAGQDVSAIAACFAGGVEFRALIPPGLRERNGAEEAAAMVAGWFADSTELHLVESRAEEVGDRLHIAYRFEGVEAGEPYVVEQHLFCVLADGVIERAQLLCSGFRPRDRD